MEWTRSNGGPLICLEEQLCPHWLGTTGLDGHEVSSPGDLTDYERACQVRDYLGTINLVSGRVLILGDMPLETSVWQAASGTVHIVRLFYADPHTDFARLLREIDPRLFDTPDELLQFEVSLGRMVLFDSAFRGAEPRKRALSFHIPPGKFRIATKTIDPDDRTSMVLHKFYPLM